MGERTSDGRRCLGDSLTGPVQSFPTQLVSGTDVNGVCELWQLGKTKVTTSLVPRLSSFALCHCQTKLETMETRSTCSRSLWAKTSAAY